MTSITTVAIPGVTASSSSATLVPTSAVVSSTANATMASSSSSNPVSALMAGRATVAAPPSLSTVNHSDVQSNSRARDRIQRLTGRAIQITYRPDLQQALSPPTAAVPISTRENISTFKSWSTLSPSAKNVITSIVPGAHGDSFAVHPSFQKDAEQRGDVLVRVDGVEFYVHKHILLFSSPFFASILEGEWKESRLSAYLDSSDAGSEGEEDTEKEEISETSKAVKDAKAAESIKDELEEAEADKVTADPVAPSNRPASETNSEESLPVGSPEGHQRQSFRNSNVRASYYTARISLEDEDIPADSNDSSPEDRQDKLAASQRALEGLFEKNRNASSADPMPTSHNVETELKEDKSATRLARRRSASLGSVQDKPVRTHKTKRSIVIQEATSKLGDKGGTKAIPTRKSSRIFNPALLADSRTSREHESEPSSSQARFQSLATPPGTPQRDRFAASTEPSATMTRAQVSPSTAKLLRREKSKKRSGYGNMIAVIDLEEETASTFHDFLFHIYPHLDLSVTWFNCGPMLRFADKFQVPYMRRCCVTFLRAALAGRPIEAMRLAELHRLDDLYKEASRHVLDNFAAWELEELEVLSKETLLKLERKRTWFLERMLKLGLCSPARDYECHANCPDPQACAKALQERWQTAYTNAFRFSPPQPSVIFRHLRELDGAPFLAMSACQSTARAWVQLLFDRMFSLGTLHTPRQFLAIKLDTQVPRTVFKD